MNFNWKEKMFLIILLCVLFTSLGMSFRHKPAEKMQIFPSYDWGSEEEEVLAYISANTNGTDKDKQQAVIDCLDYVWNANHHLIFLNMLLRNINFMLNQPSMIMNL